MAVFGVFSSPRFSPSKKKHRRYSFAAELWPEVSWPSEFMSIRGRGNWKCLLRLMLETRISWPVVLLSICIRPSRPPADDKQQNMFLSFCCSFLLWTVCDFSFRFLCLTIAEHLRQARGVQNEECTRVCNCCPISCRWVCNWYQHDKERRCLSN